MGEIFVKVFIQNYASISGRANRTEYWVWQLVQLLIAILFGGLRSGISSLGKPMLVLTVYILAGVVSVAMLLPNICVTVRRLHDTGRGGGWFFILLLPLAGAIWFFVLMLLPSEPDRNRFGDVPTTSL